MAKDAKKTKKEKTKKEKVRKERTFFKELKAELKKVVWPTPKELIKCTSIVIGMILITTVIVFCLDFVFDNGYQLIVDKSETIIEKIQSSDEENTDETTEDTADEDSTDDSVEDEDTDSDETTDDTVEE